MQYSACSYCCKQIANNDFDRENCRCFICHGRWRAKRERRLEKDRLRYRRDKEDPEKMEAMCARKQFTVRRAAVIQENGGIKDSQAH